MRKISMIVSAAALATVLALGVSTMAPVTASASPEADTLQQREGYRDPWGSTPYGSSYWHGWSSAGLPSYWSNGYDYFSPDSYVYRRPWAWNSWYSPYEGSPGYPYDYHGSYFGAGSGYGYGGPYYGGWGSYGPGFCGYGYIC